MTPDHAVKGPASAGPFRVLAVVLVVLGVAVGGAGCRAGGDSASKDKGKGGLPKGLAAKPEPLSGSDATAPGDGRATGPTPGAGGGPGSGGPKATAGTGGTSGAGGGGPGTGPGGAAPKPFHPVASSTDRSGDALGGPGYADARELRIEDNGDSAKFVVELNGAVPAQIASNETMGVGVDIYRNGGRESDYQLFADGEPEGWLAYLQTPEGHVKFPGTFELGATRLVFIVPWSAVGGRGAGAMSLFVDWSQDVGLPVDKTSTDHVPDSGTKPFTP